MCDDLWDIKDANVVCRQLGFFRASGAPGLAKYGQGSGPIWMDDVKCKGGETSLLQCPHPALGANINCDHAEDASVECV